MLTNGNFKHQRISRCCPAAIFFQKKQNTMPKRDHERRTREGGGKIKASKLDIKNLSPKQSPSLDSDASYITGDQGLVRNSVFTSAEISVRDKVENPTATSQEWRRDDNPFSCTVKSVREINQGSSMVKPVRGIQNLLTRMKLDHQNLEVSDDPYVAIHLGQKYNENLIPYRNNNFDALNTLDLESRRGWSWISITRFWMFPRLSGASLPGWNLPCCMTK